MNTTIKTINNCVPKILVSKILYILSSVFLVIYFIFSVKESTSENKFINQKYIEIEALINLPNKNAINPW